MLDANFVVWRAAAPVPTARPTMTLGDDQVWVDKATNAGGGNVQSAL